MQSASQVSLKPYNTFGIDATADKLIVLEEASETSAILSQYPEALIIGGGSNILFTKPGYDVVILNRIKGLRIIQKNSDSVIISAGSGENWHELVQWSLSHSFGGLENLSLIPGTAGAAPIQNIGAYGVELKDVFHGVDYFRFDSHTTIFIERENCRFGYRDSIFKNEWKNHGFITRIYLKLTSQRHHINIEYKALRQYLDDRNITGPSIHQVSEAVIAIRESKLPDWRKWGNAGSFFKNPVVAKSFYKNLKSNYPDLPYFPVDETRVKIPAAWLIQEAGFKGRRMGAAGCYEKQPLVLVNYGGAGSDDILRLKQAIQETINTQFGIYLIPEVTLL